jgi:CRISPR type I-D-associated protein Csc2
MTNELAILTESTWLSDGLVAAAEPLFRRETTQIAIVREVQDYTVLRTEETRELNTVWTQTSAGDATEIERIAFLASKQKGAESRELESLLRTWYPNAKPCYLKSSLCMTCPRCVLFGATDVSGADGKGANIKHRIAYATAFSLRPAEALREVHTFNGVDGATQLTGQTLGDRQSVRPGGLFASIVTLRSATELELLLALKTILSCTRYGAETRIGGLVRNHVVGVVAAAEEIVSPLELTLRLADVLSPTPEHVAPILTEFKGHSSTPKRVHVASPAELSNLLKEVQNIDFDENLLKKAYDAAAAFTALQAGFFKNAKAKKKE